MRTRIYNKMTTPEVDAYLARGGDTMFIAVGVVECHGNMPIDVETILPEAYCKLMAEKADGLAMINLPYFYPGGTLISNATVHMSIRDGMDYLMKICRSLVAQGFKRLFLVSGHAPASLTLDPFCRDFFEETLIHPCSITNVTGKPRDWSKMGDPKAFEDMNAKSCGAYKIMGQMEYLPVDPNWEAIEQPRVPEDPVMQNFARSVRSFGGVASLVFSDPNQHGGGRIFKSEEERLEVCTMGEQLMREEVAQSPILELKEALGQYQDYVQRQYQKFPRLKVK